jgi:hypothetical protein
MKDIITRCLNCHIPEMQNYVAHTQASFIRTEKQLKRFLMNARPAEVKKYSDFFHNCFKNYSMAY